MSQQLQDMLNGKDKVRDISNVQRQSGLRAKRQFLMSIR